MSKMNANTLFVLCALAATAFATTPFELCKGDPVDVKVTGVAVPGCDAAPCVINKGSNISISITFTTSKAYKTLTNKVYGELKGIDVPFPGYPPNMVDVCTLGVKCPTTAGSSYTEKVSLPVSSSDPSISLLAKWKINGDGSEAGCFLMPLKIV